MRSANTSNAEWRSHLGRRGRRRLLALALAAAGLAAGARPVLAAPVTLYWGSSGTTNSNWSTDTGDVNWSTTSGGAASTYWTDGNDASFGTSATVAVNGTVAPNAITLTGSTNINAGTTPAQINLGAGGLSDSVKANLAIGANVALEGSQTWTINNTYNTLAISGKITDGSSGAAELTINAVNSFYQNKLNLTAANSHSGGTINNGADLLVGNNAALGSGTLTLGPAADPNAKGIHTMLDTSASGITISNQVQVASGISVTVNNSGGGTFSLNGNITGGGTGTVINFGTTNYHLGGDNSGYVGTVGINQGVTLTSFTAGDANALWTGGNPYGPIDLAVGSDGTISLGALSGSVPLESKDHKNYSVEVGGAGLTQTYSGNIGNTSYPQLKVVIVGGQETFTNGASNYQNGTEVQAGTLLVDNTTGSATGTGAVLVDAAGHFGGSGSFTGALTNNGTLVAGDTAGTTLHATGGTTLGDSSAIAITLATPDVAGGTNGNGLLSTASLTLGSGVNVEVTQGTNFGLGTYALIDYSGTLTNGTDLSSWTATGLAGYAYAFSLGSDNGVNAVNLTVSAIPEPASLALLALGGVMILTPRRKMPA